MSPKRAPFSCTRTYRKPGSVLASHLSSLSVAAKLERLTITERAAFISYLLATGRVYLSNRVTAEDCGPLPHSFHHFRPAVRRIGCVVSVALSLGLLPVAVSNCLCPMLPGLSSRVLRARATSRKSEATVLYHNSNAFARLKFYLLHRLLSYSSLWAHK